MKRIFSDQKWNITGQIICGILLSVFFFICLYYFIKYANITHVIAFALVLFMIILLIVIGILLTLNGIDELLSSPPDDKVKHD